MNGCGHFVNAILAALHALDQATDHHFILSRYEVRYNGT
jgi:hypothetical protein